MEEQLGKECFQNCNEAIQRFYKQDKLLIFIGKGKLCVGIFVISDKIRPNIPQLIEKLRSQGVKEIVMLTGDSLQNAKVIAKQAGIQNVKAELLPEQKVAIIAQLKKQYARITMIGDGINDAPALAIATTGIAMGALGSAISAETADIVLIVDDVSKVGDTIAISQRTIHIAKESIWIGMGLSFLLMCIALFGVIPPAIGALLQEGIDVAVILNALRVR